MRVRWAMISAWAALKASSAFRARSRQVASRAPSWPVKFPRGLGHLETGT